MVAGRGGRDRRTGTSAAADRRTGASAAVGSTAHTLDPRSSHGIDGQESCCAGRGRGPADAAGVSRSSRPRSNRRHRRAPPASARDPRRLDRRERRCSAASRCRRARTGSGPDPRRRPSAGRPRRWWSTHGSGSRSAARSEDTAAAGDTPPPAAVHTGRCSCRWWGVCTEGLGCARPRGVCTAAGVCAAARGVCAAAGGVHGRAGCARLWWTARAHREVLVHVVGCLHGSAGVCTAARGVCGRGGVRGRAGCAGRATAPAGRRGTAAAAPPSAG